MNRTLVTALFLIAVLSLSSTGAVADWDKTFGGVADDSGRCIQETLDEGYIIVARTESSGSGSADIWLIKTDSNGNTQWEKTFGGAQYDKGEWVQQTNDGGYIIVGHTSSFGAGDFDVLLIKTDSNGTRQWHKVFGGIQYDTASCVQQTSDGGYIIAGATSSFGAGNKDAWLIKTDANGNVIWSRTFGGISEDKAYSVQQTTDGGFILAGTTWSFGAGMGDVWLVKTDSGGTLEWDETFGGIDLEEGSSVQQTADGGFIVAGTTWSFGAGAGDAWLIKTDASGNGFWNKAFGGTAHDWGHSVQQTDDGGYIVAGYTYSYGAGASDAWLIKTDSGGTLEWDETFGGTESDVGRVVRQTSDGGYILVGGTNSFGAGAADVWLIKIGSGGLTQINLSSPTDGSTLVSTPTFAWTSDGGADNRYVVDLHIPGLVALWTSPIVFGASWTMPDPVWNFITSGTQVYWRVRGADLDVAPLTIITSDEVWSFTKE